jgi:hypothetical protein
VITGIGHALRNCARVRSRTWLDFATY